MGLNQQFFSQLLKFRITAMISHLFNPVNEGTKLLLQLTNLWPSGSGSNWNLEMLVFEERGKLEYPEENLSEQGREPTTNSTHL